MSKFVDKNMLNAVKELGKIFDRLEGRHSGIPQCCVETYANGRTYLEYKNSLSEKDVKKLDKWGYVPCDKCFEENYKVKILKNGTSDLGQIILCIQRAAAKYAVEESK